jgi:hypothetical protein
MTGAAHVVACRIRGIGVIFRIRDSDATRRHIFRPRYGSRAFARDDGGWGAGSRRLARVVACRVCGISVIFRIRDSDATRAMTGVERVVACRIRGIGVIFRIRDSDATRRDVSRPRYGSRAFARDDGSEGAG